MIRDSDSKHPVDLGSWMKTEGERQLKVFERRVRDPQILKEIRYASQQHCQKKVIKPPKRLLEKKDRKEPERKRKNCERVIMISSQIDERTHFRT